MNGLQNVAECWLCATFQSIPKIFGNAWKNFVIIFGTLKNHQKTVKNVFHSHSSKKHIWQIFGKFLVDSKIFQ